MKPKAYAPRTVIAAHRRVLSMVINTLGRMSKRELETLRACGHGGMVTLSEVADHVRAALRLKVKR